MWPCDPALVSTVLGSYQVAGPLFVQTLQTFLAAHCALVGDHLWPPDATSAVIEDPNYDFIVIGAGSSGSVVANRLSEISDWKVLLVEAGGNPSLATVIPQLFYNNMNTDDDWGYKTQPQKGACRSYKSGGCAWPRGKILGGCSSINGMFYVRGNKIDYDEWAADGITGWSYNDVLPYFKKSENFTSPLSDEKRIYHGTDGYLTVENTENFHDIEKLIINAASELGLNVVDDVNEHSQMGIARSLSTTKDGIRHSTARAFLNPIKDRSNLHVIKKAYATKILFKPNTNEVDGVLLNKDDKNVTVKVRKELILAAGAINTPQLLLLSGIGPRKHLEDMNIDLKADLPVGENLQDHLFVPIFYSMVGDKSLSSLSNIIGVFAESILHNKGPLSDVSPHKIISFINTTDSNAISPDLQNHYLVFTPRLSNLLDVYKLHDLSDEFYKKFTEMNDEKLIIKVYNVLLKPKSRGRILLKSKNPSDHPLIYANYFENPEDMRTLINGIKQHAMQLAKTKSFQEAGLKLDWVELDACKSYNKNTDEFLDCIARELTFSLYHPTSTVKMGPDNDPTAVVNPELKVKYSKGLRVIDASIMPTIVRGNTNAPTIMIGEKGADMIKRDWLTHDEL